MKRIMLVAAIAVLSFNAALARDFTAAQRAACKSDYDKFCTMAGGGRVLACLNKQHDQLSDACKQGVNAQKK